MEGLGFLQLVGFQWRRGLETGPSRSKPIGSQGGPVVDRPGRGIWGIVLTFGSDRTSRAYGQGDCKHGDGVCGPSSGYQFG